MEPTILIMGIIAMVVLILLTVLYILIYSGFFHSIVVGAGKPPVQDLYVAYKYRKGPYKEAGQLFTEIVNLAPNQRCLGVYYDDPEQVPPERTRYIVGCVMAEGSQRPDKALAELLERKRYKFTYFPAATNVVKTTFPFTTTFSIYIAISRVYPRLGSYIREHKLCAHPIMEIYDGALIHFMAPLARQDEFYVPETDPNYVPEPDREELDFIPLPPEAAPQQKHEPSLSESIQAPKVDTKTDAEQQGESQAKTEQPPEAEAPKSADTGATTQQETGKGDADTKARDEGTMSLEQSTGLQVCDVLTDTAALAADVTTAQVPPAGGANGSGDNNDDKSSSSSFEEVPRDLEEMK